MVILDHESLIRLGVFLSVLLLMMLWEGRLPRRQRLFQRKQRWPVNLSLAVINTIFLKLCFPLSAAGWAWFLSQHPINGGGLLGLWENRPVWAEILVSLLLLDALVYWQHRLFHQFPWLWRLHLVHHTDPDFDTTTALRFHPLEILISMVIKFAGIFLLGAPVIAVVLFEMLLNGVALFNHANGYLPEKMDLWLRRFIVTPDMHRVHHSVIPVETNSNFGFCLPWWDHLFGSYRDLPQGGHEKMSIGLEQYQHLGSPSLPVLAALPFVKPDKFESKT